LIGFQRVKLPPFPACCVKCKAKREIANGVEETMKNGRKAIKGKCPTCGTVMFKILGGKATAPAATPANPPTS
jgi:hypothetical protein